MACRVFRYVKSINYGNYILTLGLISALAGCATTYSYNPIEVHVIDAETKQPLEGVIVVAHWSLVQSTVGGNSPVGTLQVMETISDKDGRIYFSEWGPKSVYKGHLDRRGAQIELFKPGYETGSFQNSDMLWQGKHPKTSQWHGKTVELKPFNGSLKERANMLKYLDVSLGNVITFTDNCEWKRIPEMVIAMQREKYRLEQSGIDTSSIRGLNLFPHRNCESAVEYFNKREHE